MPLNRDKLCISRFLIVWIPWEYQLKVKRDLIYNRRIFPEKLALCLFDLPTVTFQGQTFLTVLSKKVWPWKVTVSRSKGHWTKARENIWRFYFEMGPFSSLSTLQEQKHCCTGLFMCTPDPLSRGFLVFEKFYGHVLHTKKIYLFCEWFRCAPFTLKACKWSDDHNIDSY